MTAWDTSAVDKRFVDKTAEKIRHVDKILFCWHNGVHVCWKRKDTFKTQNIYKISLQKGLTVCENRCQASAVACLTLSPSLFTWPVAMIHRITRSLDFGRNITAFISWPLFCRQLSLPGWNLTWHVDKDDSTMRHWTKNFVSQKSQSHFRGIYIKHVFCGKNDTLESLFLQIKLIESCQKSSILIITHILSFLILGKLCLYRRESLKCIHSRLWLS